MTERDIRGYASIITSNLLELVGADLDPQAREKGLAMASAACSLVENLLVDINRIANAHEEVLLALDRLNK